MKISRPCFLARSTRSFGVGGRAGVGVALAQVELPARLLPAVEAGVCDELDPLALGHVAELAADQADLVVGGLAVAVRGGLLEAHGRGPEVMGGMWGQCTGEARWSKDGAFAEYVSGN